MPIEDLFSRERRAAAYEAVVLDSAAGPSDPVRVALVNYDAELAFGPGPWTPRGDGVLPVRGDRALVVFSDERVPWILAYDPA